MNYTAKELLDKAEELRRSCSFGEAINLYRAAADAPDATEDIKRKSDNLQFSVRDLAF